MTYNAHVIILYTPFRVSVALADSRAAMPHDMGLILAAMDVKVLGALDAHTQSTGDWTIHEFAFLYALVWVELRATSTTPATFECENRRGRGSFQ